ncbi:hypothetical protein FRACYDRAFT_246972 [Fragilariopsis cylindrus CCMP1102]|uniref:GAT domain-containing protein n=1 Tax=Fragilariopsis cylindrus CCMP1102 TaxID=635003 RepID=A0A1E7EX59_9STRA|nr:hypothetical protein FRACYDRAFT_246972 [Fragilariopsis cylindrus CCMP1102]|eukprot:OEU10492.1 hypothetical protein FRACYDRAFT_246972 [Fragilariopsis cylindrus CCMP1102]
METTTLASSSLSSSSSPADIKISNDLIIVKEKMDVLDTMLNPNSGPDLASPKLSVVTNDSIRSVIGYLDACAPRMIELVTACTSTSFGVLSEDVFNDVLGCNDRLQKLLTDVDTRILIETPAMTTAASSASSAGTPFSGGGTASADNNDNDTAAEAAGAEVEVADINSLTAASAAANAPTVSAAEELFGDLLLGNEDPFADAHGSGSSGSSSAGIDTGTASTTEAETAAAADDDAVTTDPFDDFFAERTTSDN